jgi:hypothetical protein
MTLVVDTAYVDDCFLFGGWLGDKILIAAARHTNAAKYLLDKDYLVSVTILEFVVWTYLSTNF